MASENENPPFGVTHSDPHPIKMLWNELRELFTPDALQM